MNKIVALAQLERLLHFLESYAAKHPSFSQELEAALDATEDSKTPLKTAIYTDPHEYVAEYDLPAFEEHLLHADEEQVRHYAKRLKLKASKKLALSDLRQQVLQTMRQQFNKGSAFARQDTFSEKEAPGAAAPDETFKESGSLKDLPAGTSAPE
ncbi:hypothetical protein [Deinococcus aquatilis]|uniref:hypothetical protein n=1 Tax=Deinococcus aquatilis TaxID=519440 RepID=UPI000361220D|nr:hypothetical protein [Deinococcus aquatilis]